MAVITAMQSCSTASFNFKSASVLNASFETNKNKLPWPVDQGYVCTHFGSYQIENTKIKGDNAGITICTQQSGVNVKTVFDGEVVAVFNVGDSKAVMVRHGKYFTVYSNLKSVNVKRGQKVTTKEAIGTVATDDEQGPSCQFQVWKGKTPMNPSQWLAN